MSQLTLMPNDCTSCGLPMILEWTSSGDRHANCLHTRQTFVDHAHLWFSPEDQERITMSLRKFGTSNDQKVTAEKEEQPEGIRRTAGLTGQADFGDQKSFELSSRDREDIIRGEE